MSLKGWALVEVIVSKQGVKVTAGGATLEIVTGLLVAGLPLTQVRDELRTQEITSLLLGMQEKEGRLLPASDPFIFQE